MPHTLEQRRREGQRSARAVVVIQIGLDMVQSGAEASGLTRVYHSQAGPG